MRTTTLRGFVEHRSKSGGTHRRPGRIVRGRDEYEFRALGDGVRHGIKIKGAVGKRHRNELSTHRIVSIGYTERSPRRDDFVPRIDVGQESCWMSPTDPHPTVT